MGVSNFLLKVLDSAGTKIDLRKYRDGITVKLHRTHKRKKRKIRIAVDASLWIYKACYKYSSSLADDKHLTNHGRYQLIVAQATQPQQIDRERSERRRRYVTECCLFVLRRLQSLQHETDCELLAVLDGATPPVKLKTVLKRSHERKDNARIRDAPIDTEAVSRNMKDDQDYEALVRERLKANRRAGAGDLYSEVVEELLVAMRTNFIPFMVAPYEADAQLAMLSKEKYVDLVISEDSDLVGLGCTCVMFQMDISKNEGFLPWAPEEGEEEKGDKSTSNQVDRNKGAFKPEGMMLTREDLGAARMSSIFQYEGTNTLMDLSDAALAVLFVLAGSDYCEKINGIGLTTACKIVQESFHRPTAEKIPPLERVFELAFQKAYNKEYRTNKKLQDEFKEQFLDALLMYRHPIVFDPIDGRFVIWEDEGDPELLNYEPYQTLFYDKERRTSIVGDLDSVDKTTATLMAEGWISPRSRHIYVAAKAPNAVTPKALKELLTKEQGGDDSTVLCQPAIEGTKQVHDTLNVMDASGELDPSAQSSSARQGEDSAQRSPRPRKVQDIDFNLGLSQDDTYNDTQETNTMDIETQEKSLAGISRQNQNIDLQDAFGGNGRAVTSLKAQEEEESSDDETQDMLLETQQQFSVNEHVASVPSPNHKTTEILETQNANGVDSAEDSDDEVYIIEIKKTHRNP